MKRTDITATITVSIVLFLFVMWLISGWATGYDKVCRYYDHHSKQYCVNRANLYEGKP